MFYSHPSSPYVLDYLMGLCNITNDRDRPCFYPVQLIFFNIRAGYCEEYVLHLIHASHGVIFAALSKQFRTLIETVTRNMLLLYARCNSYPNIQYLFAHR